MSECLSYLHCMWLGDGDGAGGIRTDDNDDKPVVFTIFTNNITIMIM